MYQKVQQLKTDLFLRCISYDTNVTFWLIHDQAINHKSEKLTNHSNQFLASDFWGSIVYLEMRWKLQKWTNSLEYS